MQCFSPIKQINNFFSSLYVSEAESAVVYAGHSLKVILPKNPLAEGSLRIESQDEAFHLSAWTKAHHEEAFELILKIIDIWKKSNLVGDYMVYGKVISGEKFAWEIVPYPKTQWKIRTVCHQLKILFNITFGAKVVGAFSHHSQLAQFYNKTLNKLIVQPSLNAIVNPKGADNFCKDEVINRQSVYEGKLVRILYNYAPLLGKEKPHLLQMPISHREKFEDLTKEEYVELAIKRGRCIEHYEKKGFKTVYLYSNNGSIQSQKHFHEHFIPTSSKADEIWGKLKVLRGLLLPFLTSKLNNTEMKNCVNLTRKELEVSEK